MVFLSIGREILTGGHLYFGRSEASFGLILASLFNGTFDYSFAEEERITPFLDDILLVSLL